MVKRRVMSLLLVKPIVNKISNSAVKNRPGRTGKILKNHLMLEVSERINYE
jgi:hypothetical protein